MPPTQGALPAEQLSFLTFNVQKVGSISTSLTDIVSILDFRTPDFLLLTETPPLPHSGALTHTMRNQGYKIYYYHVNAPTPPDTLPETRLPTHLTHSGERLMDCVQKTHAMGSARPPPPTAY